MPRQVPFDEWEQEQRRRDPEWDRSKLAFEKAHGPKRKVPLLLDEIWKQTLLMTFARSKTFASP